jgi:enoyl-CoA hydratase
VSEAAADTAEVLFRTAGKAGIISLNKPKTIHALTLGMCEAMIAQLQAWAEDPAVEIVLLDHAEGRGFCSGGDINLLRQSALNDGGEAGRRFFFVEYQLNELMFDYAKPIVAFMDGITMGGGVGIAEPARYRVATENTRFAMPETGIGLFPDVGGGWYLSRLDGRLGAWLAITGARLDGAECVAAGLATHYLPAERLADAKARIAAEPATAEAILSDLSAPTPEAKYAAHRTDIDRLFASNRLEDILAALEADGSEWAAGQLATLRTKSPQACKVSLRQLRESLSCASFVENMVMEYRIGGRVITFPDFAEGVRAVIVEKDNAPKWNPATPEGVSEALLDSIFAPLPADQEWRPL